MPPRRRAGGLAPAVPGKGRTSRAVVVLPVLHQWGGAVHASRVGKDRAGGGSPAAATGDAAVLFVEKRAGRDKLLAVVRRTLDGEPFEQALDRETRWSMVDLEREFADWVEHLR